MEQNAMLKQMEYFPEVFRKMEQQLLQKAADILQQEQLENISMVYLVGSGDSYNAAVTSAYAFEKYTKIPTVAVSALTAARYLPDTITKERAARTLIVMISNSGEAARSAEAARMLKRAGCIVMALTDRPDSKVGRVSDYIFHMEIPVLIKQDIPLPGVYGYEAQVLSLYWMALQFALKLKRLSMDEQNSLQEEFSGFPDMFQDAFRLGEDTLRKFAGLCRLCGRLEIIGGGPLRGAGDFGVSKILEINGMPVCSQDTEEFAHQTFFSEDPDRLPTVLLISSLGCSKDRSLEILQVLQHLGRPVLVMTDDSCILPEKYDGMTICLPKPVSETMAAFLYSGMLSCMAAMIPHRVGDTYMHGHMGPFMEEGLPTVRGSRICIEETEV